MLLIQLVSITTLKEAEASVNATMIENTQANRLLNIDITLQYNSQTDRHLTKQGYV